MGVSIVELFRVPYLLLPLIVLLLLFVVLLLFLLKRRCMNDLS